MSDTLDAHPLQWNRPTIFTTLILAYLLWKITYALLLDPHRDIPGPFIARFSRLWNIRQAYTGTFHRSIVDLHRQHGRIVRIAPNVYSFDHPEDQKKIYSLKSDFVKTEYYSAASAPQHDNIFSLRDEKEHADRKRRIGALYSMATMVSYEHAIDQNVETFLRKFEQFAREKRVVDVPRFVNFYAFDVINAVTLGKHFGTMERERDSEENVIEQMQGLVLYQHKAGIVVEVHRVLRRVALVMIEWFKYIPPGPFVKVIVSGVESYRATARHETTSTGSEPFMKKIMRLENEGTVQMSHVYDAVGSNIAAGADTTSITLSAALYYLYKDREGSLVRLRGEIDRWYADRGSSTKLDFKAAQQMPYLTAVIAETLRMHPAVSYILERYVPTGGAELGGRYFSEGTVVGVSAWALYRNKGMYGEDADVFRPERFIDARGKCTARLAESFAFGAGTRSCLGKNISLLEMYKLIPQVVRHYDLKFEADAEWNLNSVWFTWSRFSCHVEPRVLDR